MNGNLLPFLAVTGLVMLAPGPSVLFAVTHRVRGGPRAGLWAVLGLESGLSVHVVAACLGISAVVAASPVTLQLLRVIGACYLALLGLRLLRPRPSSNHPGPGIQAGRGNVYRAGIMVDLLNPKTLLYVVALLPQFLDGTGGSVAGRSVLLGLCVVGVALVCDGGYTLLAGHLHDRLLGPGDDGRSHRLRVAPGTTRLARWAECASGCSFLGLALVAALG